MASLQGFNANDVDPSTEYEPIPSGKYLAMIIESETKPTKSGKGSYLQLTFQVLEGDYKNRIVWARPADRVLGLHGTVDAGAGDRDGCAGLCLRAFQGWGQGHNDHCSY
jgi:hypothetical protein